jgi:aspartate/tyrosine/aromatic aminotransferase
MFSDLQPAPADPILGLMARFREDARIDKLDLGVGVYRDASGKTPVMRAVRAAEQLRLAEEDTKTYQGMLGDVAFGTELQALSFGMLAPSLGERLATVHTPGGTAALRVAADLVKAARPQARVWLADPSWDNHAPLFRAAGLEVATYPYLDAARATLREDALLAALDTVAAGDVVLFQASCHNPAGIDIGAALWTNIAETANRRGFVPLVDMAYQGLGDGLDEDAGGLRTLAARVPELLLTASCSKNFGLYRERTGAVSLLAATPAHTRAALSVLLRGIRANYSMPPAHGAAIVARVLARPELRADWLAELDAMRAYLGRMREDLAAAIEAEGDDPGSLRQRHGMFAIMALPEGGAERLRQQHGIYLLDSGRINLAGLGHDGAARLARALHAL